MTTPLHHDTMTMYLDQTEKGFRGLKFVDELESRFREIFAQAFSAQLRVAMASTSLFAIVLTYYAVSRDTADSGTYILLTQGAATLLLSLALFLSTFRDVGANVKSWLGIALGAALAFSLVLGNAYARQGDPGNTTAGYVLITFFIYFFLGLRFRPAILASSLILVGILVAALTSSAHSVSAGSIFFVVFANLIAASGLYNLEYTFRISFMKQVKLEKVSRLDSLTGLYTRAAFEEKMGLAWAECSRNSQPLSVALIDVDNFKAYNDTYGHQAGDDCLRILCQLISNSSRRPMDLAARYGGEEFVLLLSGCNSRDATEILESLCTNISKLAIPHTKSSNTTHVTISAGVATVEPHTCAHDAMTAIKSADEALYRAKQYGRDQVVVADHCVTNPVLAGWFQPQRTKKPEAVS